VWYITYMQRLNFNKLSATDFEDFSFHLLSRVGFVNVDWRKGTPLPSSPADRGRDIVCQHLREDVDNTRHLETWFVDCKRFNRAVPATELQNALAWAEAECPDVLLFILSGFLSNPAKDYLEKYALKRRLPFRIKYWERPQLEQIAGPKRTLLAEFGLVKEKIRSLKEVQRAEQEYYDKRWYDRHSMMWQLRHEKRFKKDLKVMVEAHKGAKEIERKYGKKNLGPYSDHEWGVLAGKHAALRWVLGDEWDNFDT
jgi:hypothetical protein